MTRVRSEQIDAPDDVPDGDGEPHHGESGESLEHCPSVAALGFRGPHSIRFFPSHREI